MTPRYAVLHGRASSLVLECPEAGAPLWRYWGPRLADDLFVGPALADTRPTPSFSLDEPISFSVFPTFGLGWFGQSALLAHRDGRDFTQGFTTSRITESVGKIDCHCDDPIAHVGLRLELALDPETDVLTVRTTLINTGLAPLAVEWLAAAALPLPDASMAVEHFGGRHNREFVPLSDLLGRGTWRRENRRGLTSHECFPGAYVTLPGTTDHEGVAYGAQLAWSGNSVQSIEWLDDGRFQWQLGEWLAPGEVVLSPGEALEAPTVLATCSTGGRNGVAANFHAAVRERMAWPQGKMKPRPVTLNTWEGYWFDHDPTKLMQLADAASAVGIERFVLDDGWFAGRNNDTSSLGDWTVDAHKYPEGLAPLARHVTGLGMEFGLWIEPEMISPDSDLFRAHPEWALQVAGRPLSTARNQLVLDLTRPEAADHVFGSIAAVIRDLPVSYMKWDHNRDLAPAAGAEGRAIYRRQVIAAYALVDRFRAAFPNVEIEACAGGGGRIDAGIATRTHRFWTSDCIDALLRTEVQRGFLRFMPPELMGAHIGAQRCHSTGRTFDIGFQAAVASQGHLGVEFDLLKLGEPDRGELARWIAFYKQWRHLLGGQRVWTGSASDGIAWHAAGSPDEWLLFLYRLEPMTQRHASPVRLPFVDEGVFAVSEVSPGSTGKAMRFDGTWLARAGLPIPPGFPQTATIWYGRRA